MNIHSIVIHNSQWQKQRKCPSAEETINKTWHIRTKGIHLTKKDKVLINQRTWMNLKNLVLIERSQTLLKWSGIR